MNNFLTLRTLTSPFGDFTKGSVLSHGDLDDNFIFLKSQLIYTAYTETSDIILKKYNGDEFVLTLNIPNESTNVTGGTYNDLTGISTFTNSTGGTFDVSGYFKTSDDTYITATTFNNGSYILTLFDNKGNQFSDDLSILATDMTVTGGTFDPNTGIATFTNNSGGTFGVSGFLTGQTDTYWISGNSGVFSVQIINDSTTNATGDYAFATGFNTAASGNSSTAQGSNTIASGIASHAEGDYTIASNYASHAEGGGTIASGNGAHAEGNGSQAIGDYSHAESDNTIASGYASHSEGSNTIASGFTSHAEGNYTIAGGDFSHAGGSNSIASGQTSFVHGLNSQANGVGTIVLGNNITGTTNHTVYVPNLTITNTPSSATTSDTILSRSTGGTVNEIEQVDGYLISGTTVGNLLSNVNNWTINGSYTGTTITGTYQGQSFYDDNYWFTAVGDNLWIRLIRG